MDAPDDNKDIKLYRASVDLLSEISQQLSDLLIAASDTKEPPEHQLWVPDSQVRQLVNLVSNFFDDWKIFS